MSNHKKLQNTVKLKNYTAENSLTKMLELSIEVNDFSGEIIDLNPLATDFSKLATDLSSLVRE